MEVGNTEILFINANLHGHINPTLPLVKELTGRGNRVDYFCCGSFKEMVTNTGAELISYSDELERFLSAYRPTDRHPFYMLTEYMLLYAEAMLPCVPELIKSKRYDIVIGDSMFGGPCFLRRMSGVPVISSHSSFVMSRPPVPDRMLAPGTHPQLDNCIAIIERLCGRYSISAISLSEIFLGQTEHNIVYTIPEFNGEERLDASRFLFTGSGAQNALVRAIECPADMRGRPVIYISLGSVNTDHADFYSMCIEAFKDSPYYVFMSTGGKCDIGRLGAIPENFRVGSYLPQLSILARADAFITHAGFNSVNEALYFGVPMLALPMVNDQHIVAKRVKDMGLGIAGGINDMTPRALKECAEKLLSDNAVRESCARVSEKFRAFKGLPLVAEALEAIGEAGRGGAA